ncbi:DUF3006 domain-containing protein [Halobellus ordinarius]|uniref:DUF3006 domain-containing protein n=1 Tax=Halobellus ordinarius TaxID=3075120 RepID=UPI0028805CDF|nr:DUF3006 domain-containing protein [Halobellus sp. ZY16]
MSNLEALDDGQYTAVVDTIEDGLATIFFEQDGDEVGDAIIDANTLPADARHADAILTVEIAAAEINQMDYEPERTETRKQSAQDRFDRLSSRPPRDDDSS